MESVQTIPVKETSETMRLIYKRRAVRKYRDRPVDKKLIQQVIDAGRMAPSAINRQPWAFYVLNERKTIQTFAKEISAVAFKALVKSGIKQIAKTASHLLDFSHGLDIHALQDPVFHGAPVVIFITAQKDNEWAPLDIGMCAENIMLAATSLGLETCPIGFAKYVDKTKSYPKLRIPSSEQVLLAIILGYGDEQPQAHERKKDNLFFID